MLLPIHEALRAALRSAITRLYGIDGDAMPSIAVQMPPNRGMGDLAVPVAFELARIARKAPRQIAQELADDLGPVDGVAAVEPAPNGYVNVFLDRVAFLTGRAGVADPEPAADPNGGVESSLSAGPRGGPG